MLQCFQLRAESRQRGVIGAEAFEFFGRNLLSAQPVVFLAQACEFVSGGLCALECDA